jgi:hypothetical protein
MRNLIKKIFTETNFLILFLIVSVLLNCVLAYTVYSTKNKIEGLYAAIEYDKGLLPGEKSPNLVAFDQKANQVQIDFDKNETPTILYIFTPDCPFCIQI